MKDPYSTLNTHMKVVKGAYLNGMAFNKAKVWARFTSDDRGETLSLAVGTVQIVVDFDQLADLIEETRAARKTN